MLAGARVVQVVPRGRTWSNLLRRGDQTPKRCSHTACDVTASLRTHSRDAMEQSHPRWHRHHFEGLGNTRPLGGRFEAVSPAHGLFVSEERAERELAAA